MGGDQRTENLEVRPKTTVILGNENQDRCFIICSQCAFWVCMPVIRVPLPHHSLVLLDGVKESLRASFWVCSVIPNALQTRSSSPFQMDTALTFGVVMSGPCACLGQVLGKCCLEPHACQAGGGCPRVLSCFLPYRCWSLLIKCGNLKGNLKSLWGGDQGKVFLITIPQKRRGHISH